MTDNNPERLITAKEAEAYIPPLEEMVGNYDIRSHFEACLARPPESDANVLLTGLPGTGKTNLLISYLRVRLKNPDLCREDFKKLRVEGEPYWDRMSDEDRRWWQTGTGKLYAFVQFHGATDKESTLRNKIEDCLGVDAEHSFVLLDEAGELYFNGLEEMFRPLQTRPGVTVYATAQNFHAKKRRTDSPEETDDRLRAFLRRFTHTFKTQNPTEEELLRFLVKRMRAWAVKIDHPSTLRLLVRKSGCVVGYALRPIIKAIDEPDRRLTRSLLDEYDPDPLVG